MFAIKQAVKLVVVLCICVVNYSSFASQVTNSYNHDFSTYPGSDFNCDKALDAATEHAKTGCSYITGGYHFYRSAFVCTPINNLTLRVNGTYVCDNTIAPNGGWYGCSNCKTPKDREHELESFTHGFSRISVPNSEQAKPRPNWSDLCRSIGKQCKRVVDWEYHDQPCDNWALDGSRVVLCE